MNQGADRAALVQEDEYAPLTNAEPDAGGCGETTCPFHELNHAAEHQRARRIAHNAGIHEDRDGLYRGGRRDLLAADDARAIQKPFGERERVRQNADACEIRQILRDADARTARRLIRAEIAELAGVEAARTLELHACVKI